MDNDEEEVDIIGVGVGGSYDDIATITSGQILTCDYTVHPKWNENSEGENFWSDSVPKNENINLEQNVEVLHSEEIVIEEPEPVAPICWSEEVVPQEDVVFEDDIPATIEEIVTNDVSESMREEIIKNENESILEEEVITNNDWISKLSFYQVRDTSKKYITPTNSRSLLKMTKIMNPSIQNSRSLLKANQIQIEKPIRKFKKTLTVNSILIQKNTLPSKQNLSISNEAYINSKAKFVQTVKLNKNVFEQEGFKLHGRKLRQRKLNKNSVSQNLDKHLNKVKKKSNIYYEDNNITINHDMKTETVSKASVIPEVIVKIEKSDSDIEIDIEGEEIDIATEKSSLAVNYHKNNTIKRIETQSYEIATKTSQNVCSSSTSSNLEAQLCDLSIPKYETHLNPIEISDLEKYFHKEFFEGRPTKTPEQYLRIRNHILTHWNSSNGKTYVSKTSVRGLKHGGDVNCISRIHRLLEQIGAINFGFQGKNFDYIRPLEDYMEVFVAQSRPPTKFQLQTIPILGRRRRTKTSSFSFNNNQSTEDINYTIHHLDDVHKPDVPALNKKEEFKNIQNKNMHEYDKQLAVRLSETQEKSDYHR